MALAALNSTLLFKILFDALILIALCSSALSEGPKIIPVIFLLLGQILFVLDI